MDSVFVIQDKDYHVWGALTKSQWLLRFVEKTPDRLIEMFLSFTLEGTEITVKAGPIGKEYLPKEDKSCEQ